MCRVSTFVGLLKESMVKKFVGANDSRVSKFLGIKESMKLN